MKKINRKRLNNKGFTLIELLAVVVILAVVMGIAMSSVLSSMNSSRKGSLQNSAKSAAQIFQNKYAEAQVTGSTNSVFSSYDLTVSGVSVYPLSETVGTNDLNLSASAYKLAKNSTALTATNGEYTTGDSFIVFNGDKIVACLVANNGGSYYVSNAAETNGQVEILGAKINISGTAMFACSNEEVSW